MAKCSRCDFEVKEVPGGELIHINEDGDQIIQDHKPTLEKEKMEFNDELWMAACEKLDTDLADFVVKGRGAGASDEDISGQITDCLNGETGDIWAKYD